MAIRARVRRAHAGVTRALALDTRPHHHWLVVYAMLLPYFSAYRGVALAAMLRVFATREETTTGLKAAVMALGVVEDAVLITLLLVVLSACDFVLGPRRSPPPLDAPKPATAAASVVVVPSIEASNPTPLTSSPPAPTPVDDDTDEPIVPLAVRRHVLLQGRRVLRALVHFVLVALALVPFAVDTVLLRTRGLRFTFAFVHMYVRERDYAAGVEVAAREVRLSTETSGVTLAMAVVVVGLTMLWLDLSQWHIARLVVGARRSWSATMLATPAGSTSSSSSSSSSSRRSSRGRGQDPFADPKDDAASETDYVSLEDGIHHPPRVSASGAASRSGVQRPETDGYMLATDAGGIQHPEPTVPTSTTKIQWQRVAVVIASPVMVLSVVCSVLLVLTHHVQPVVSATAMNASLNELFRLTFRTEFIRSLGDGAIDSAATYIHAETERYELFQDDVLFRTTTGFQGPLAFDVAVNASDPPNVLVLVVESFRFQDSLYLRGNQTDARRTKQQNVSLTPQFDRWAKRGVALRNLWSSWQTSRSVESILFGQVPLDDMTDTGTTTGRPTVELHGMPQLFHAKGYETTFTSGVRLKYDQWNQFMPAHGFDYVMGSTAFKAYGEKDYGLKPSDWKATQDGGQGRAGFWGVHDDITFDVLGDLMLNKTLEQRARARLQQPKKPFFITHYTISSHAPFVEYPAWFADEELPDFSTLAEDHPTHAKEITQYAKLRYFEDLALGRFLDRMQQEGVLNNTIVVITGDHGQSPERGLERPDVDEIATTRVAGAIIAEGRLGDSVGMVFDDAAEHYDLLNTLADIVGVPDGGFLQSGVGRSLKRAVPFGERPVWTNNPMRQLAVVKGHQRLSFDRRFNMIGLYDAETDPDETQDLLPTVSAAERRAWEALREQNRKLSRYFRVRWAHKCISKVNC